MENHTHTHICDIFYEILMGKPRSHITWRTLRKSNFIIIINLLFYEPVNRCITYYHTALLQRLALKKSLDLLGTLIPEKRQETARHFRQLQHF